MKVQEYLREVDADANITAIDKLQIDYGIRSASHHVEPLVILNYHQTESQKLQPYVRECRGLVLETGTWNLVARAFPRFFNWGEVTEELALFDFSDCHAFSKEDGSLVLLFNYRGKWMANTRGSFGEFTIGDGLPTWRQLICQAMGVRDLQELQLDPSLTYVCEVCSLYNKVVRKYPKPCLFLLTVYDGENELAIHDVDTIWRDNNLFLRPERFHFRSIDEVQTFLRRQEETDPTFEGVVLCDRNRLRYKVKTLTYQSFHKMYNNGELSPKHLLTLLLSGSVDVVEAYPEIKDVITKIKERTCDAYNALDELWQRTRDIPEQKAFALSIVGKPFTGLLFRARKERKELDILWRESAEMIFNNIFLNDILYPTIHK